jgi:hypothetical protein
LALSVDFPLAVVFVGVISDWDVAAFFEAVRDSSAVFPILEPRHNVAGCRGGDPA